MVKNYIAIKDSKVCGLFQTAEGIEGVENSCKYLEITYDEIKEVPVDKSDVVEGRDVKEFDSNYDLKPLQERVDLGFVKLKPEEKVENDKIVQKTLKEKIDEGIKILESNEKYDAEIDQIISKPWKERIAENTATYEDWLDEVVRPFRNQLINDCDLVYCNPERWYGYSDEQKSAWSAYKQALRDFPELDLEVVDNAEEISWPVKP